MEELLSEIMKLYVHAIGKKLDEDIMADEIKLNRATAENIGIWAYNKGRYINSTCLYIKSSDLADFVDSLVVEDKPIPICRDCSADELGCWKEEALHYRAINAEPSYKKRDREYWKDVDEPDLITDAIEKEFASSKNDIEYFTNFMVGVDNNNNLVYETAEDIAGRMFEKYKNEFYKTRKTNLYFDSWLNQE